MRPHRAEQDDHDELVRDLMHTRVQSVKRRSAQQDGHDAATGRTPPATHRRDACTRPCLQSTYAYSSVMPTPSDFGARSCPTPGCPKLPNPGTLPATRAMASARLIATGDQKSERGSDGRWDGRSNQAAPLPPPSLPPPSSGGDGGAE